MTSISACKKSVQVPRASNLILQETVFSNNETAISAVMGLYNKMITLNMSMSNGGLSIYPGLAADEIYSSSANAAYDAFATNAILSDNSIVYSNIWSTAYRNIYHANAIIEGLAKSTTVSVNLKKQLLGETKLIRAFYFFYLVNLFGDVPLTLTTDFEVNKAMPRVSESKVYEQIVADLKDAKSLLNPVYASALKTRPNKWAASAFLSRVYLYLGDWANAEAEANSVINSGMYTLETDLNKVFLNTSNEAIWQLMRETANTAEAAVFIPASATVIPAVALSASLMNAFEEGDLRKMKWINSNLIGNQIYNYPFKYKIRSNVNVTEYLLVFRLSEQYLIRAEARAEQNNTLNAISDLNLIRTRARAAVTPIVTQPLPNLPSTLSKESVLKAIAKERQTELFAEWGHRWFDLKRTGQINHVLGLLKPGWKAYGALYPIPYAETQINIYLTQNPGYGE